MGCGRVRYNRRGEGRPLKERCGRPGTTDTGEGTAGGVGEVTTGKKKIGGDGMRRLNRTVGMGRRETAGRRGNGKKGGEDGEVGEATGTGNDDFWDGSEYGNWD